MHCWGRPRWATSACIFRTPIRNGRAPPARVFWSTPSALVKQKGFTLVNVDTTVILEKPKLKNYREAIRESLARTLALPLDRVSVKFKTAEGVGPVGQGLVRRSAGHRDHQIVRTSFPMVLRLSRSVWACAASANG